MIKYILADFWKHYRQLDIFRQTKTISRVDIIKTKSVTNAFFSCPPVFLLHFSFSFSFARVIFELIRCKKKKPYCVTHFSLKWLNISLGSVSKNQLRFSPKILETPNPCTSLSFCNVEIWLQSYVAYNNIAKRRRWRWGGGGGREGERHFPKFFKVFVWDFRC